MPRKKKECSFLDAIITNLIKYKEDHHLFDPEFLYNGKFGKSVPLRYRIIADAFVFGLSLEELNEALVREGCSQLYARSPYEATLIFAFSNNLSYSEWKQLLKDSEEVFNRVCSDPHLDKGAISLSDIRSYVEANSSIASDGLCDTMHITDRIQFYLTQENQDHKKFVQFLLRNINQFSSARESSRYYFCKYLMYYLDTRKKIYINSLESGKNYDSELAKKSVFRVHTALDRKKHTALDAASLIESMPVSLGDIYDNYKTFYFEYTSIDWLNVLVDRYDLENLSEKQEKELAQYLRKYSASYEGLSDKDAISLYISELEGKEAEADREQSLESNKKNYGIGRSGENFLRKVLHGAVDLDRTTFLSFILFFYKESDVPEEHKLNESRLAEILVNCKFPNLNTDENPVDDFFVDFLNADDPMLFLFQEAEIMAMSEENFYLYNTYLKSRSEKKEIERIINE